MPGERNHGGRGRNPVPEGVRLHAAQREKPRPHRGDRGGHQKGGQRGVQRGGPCVLRVRGGPLQPPGRQPLRRQAVLLHPHRTHGRLRVELRGGARPAQGGGHQVLRRSPGAQAAGPGAPGVPGAAGGAGGGGTDGALLHAGPAPGAGAAGGADGRGAGSEAAGQNGGEAGRGGAAGPLRRLPAADGREVSPLPPAAAPAPACPGRGGRRVSGLTDAP